MIQYIHPEQVFQLDIEIAEPNGKIIGHVAHAMNRSMSLKLGRLNEFSFTLPYYIDKRGKKTKNPIINKIKTLGQARVTLNGQEEWYILSGKTRTASDDKELMEVRYVSLGYQLRGKQVRQWPGIFLDGEWRKDSLNARQVLDDLILPTAWATDYIDSEYLTKHRAFDFSSTTVLDAVYQVAERFGGIILWNTHNKTISLVKQENVGVNKGLEISYGNYLKTLSEEEMSDEIVTRLRIYGQDNLSIHRINPLGTDYVEDYGYFMYGFERDSNKRVISSSKHGMSDALCGALLDYQEAISANKGRFAELVAQQEQIEKDKAELNLTVFDLIEKIKSQENIIDVNQTTGVDASVAIAERDRLKAELVTVNANITTLNDQLTTILTEVASVRNSMKIDTILTPTLIKELDNFSYEETWEDTNYTIDTELYEDGLKAFKEMNKPRTVLNVDIVNLYRLLEGNQAWKKLLIGDKINILYEHFNIAVESQLIELNIEFDGNSISTVIANTKDLDSNDEDKKISKLIYESIGTSKTVDMSKFKWDEIHNVKNDVSELINSRWDATKNEIVAGNNETVTFDNRGLTITDSADPLRFLRATNSVLGMTKDGGNTFKVGISPDGIIGEMLIGKIIIGENLTLENSNQKFTFNQNGVTIDNSSFNLIGGTNGIKITPSEGIVVTKSDGKIKAIFNATEGMKFQEKVGSTWYDRFYWDTYNNRLVVNGEGNFSELKVQGRSVLTSDKFNIDGSVIGDATITNAKISNLSADKINTGTLTGITVEVTNAGMTNDGLTSSDIRLWAGTTHINRMNAPFRVQQDGRVVASNIDITGGSINISNGIKVGNNIELGINDKLSTKAIKFNGTDTWIYTSGSGLSFDSLGYLQFRSYSQFYGTVDFRNASVLGLNLTAKFG